MTSNDVGGSTATKADQIMKNEDYEDELSMTIVTSDVLQPLRPRTKKTMSSLPSNQQTPTHARMSQQMDHSSPDSSHSRPRMQLAVHIRSSPTTPFTPINAPASRESSIVPSRLGRTRGRPPKSVTSTRPSTPGPGAILGMKAEDHKSDGVSEPRKRGRPKGWKPGMPYSTDPASRYRRREARAAAAAAAAQGHNQRQAQEPKRRGRPPRPLPPSVREQYLKSTPDYIAYKCEWALSPRLPPEEPATCPAELQNLDTLRKHVFFVHCVAEPLVCRFSRCKEHDPPLEFQTDEQFEAHMEKDHFARYLWHRGEGYQNNGIWTLQQGDTPPAYLFDEQGNQVTPSIINQRLEDDVQQKERKRKLKRLLYLQNENAPSEEEWTRQMLGIA
jgi:hypothetical protein